MPSTQYESRRLYSLHIFKDTPSSNWTNPTIHVFPLSSQSAHKFGGRSGRYARSGPKGYPGNRDGVVNLYRLPSDQLSFLQSYVGNLNAEVEERRGRLVREWKGEAEKEAKEKFERGMRRDEEWRRLLEVKREYLKEKEKEKKREKHKASAGQQGQGDRDRIGKKASPRDIYRLENRSDYDSDDTAQEPPAIRYSNIIEPSIPSYRGRGCGCYGRPPPPPPPPLIYRAGRVVSLAPNPSTFETPWTIEDVELTFTPSAITLVPQPGPPHSHREAIRYFTEHPTATTTNTTLTQDGSIQTERTTDVKLQIATNVIAPESYTSFAVVLSRCQGVEVPRGGGGGGSAYQREREHSPARSYYSDHLVAYEGQEDEGEDWAREVTVEKYNIPPRLQGAPQFQGLYTYPGAYPPNLGSMPEAVPPRRGGEENEVEGEGEGGKVGEEVGKEEVEDRVETESKAGEGEDCDEGAVYVSVVKNGK